MDELRFALEEARPTGMDWVRRGIKVVAALVILAGLGSGYRAITPPRVDLAIVAGDPGHLEIEVRSTGRGVVDVTAELLYGQAVHELGHFFVPGREFPVFDFRPVWRTFEADLPPLPPGARLRVVALPSRQWTWQPPAVIALWQPATTHHI